MGKIFIKKYIFLLINISIRINGMNQHIQTFYYQMMQIAQQIPKEPGQQQYPQIVVNLFNEYESFLTTNDIKDDNETWWPQLKGSTYFVGVNDTGSIYPQELQKRILVRKNDIIKSLSNIYQTLVEIAKIKNNWNILYIFTSDGFGLEPIIFKLFQQAQMKCRIIYIHNLKGLYEHNTKIIESMKKYFEENITENTVSTNVRKSIKEIGVDFTGDSLIITCQRTDFGANLRLIQFITDNLSNTANSFAILDMIKNQYPFYYSHFLYSNILSSQKIKETIINIIINGYPYNPLSFTNNNLLKDNIPNIPHFLEAFITLQMYYKYNQIKNSFAYNEEGTTSLKPLFQKLACIGNMFNIAMHFNAILFDKLRNKFYANKEDDEQHNKAIFRNIKNMFSLFQNTVGSMAQFAFETHYYQRILTAIQMAPVFNKEEISMVDPSDMEKKYEKLTKKTI